MSVTKNQRGLGFQGDVIDFFSKFDEFIVHIYVCVFVLGVNRLYDVSLTVHDFLKILIPPQMLFS